MQLSLLFYIVLGRKASVLHNAKTSFFTEDDIFSLSISFFE